MKALRSARWVVYLLPGVMVQFRPKLRPRAMSAPVALLQPWSVLMSLAPVTIEGPEVRAALSWICPSLVQH